MTTLWFYIFERRIRVCCEAVRLRELLINVYGAMLQATPRDELVTPELDYSIYYKDDSKRLICVHRQGQAVECAEDEGLFLYLFEKDMTIALERIRHDLFFLHAAALEYGGSIHLLVAESGGGKSTTSWALLHHGFRYASDELSPVQLDTMNVLAYPHALCLKSEPPLPYKLPAETLRTNRTLHVPTESLPSDVVNEVLPLKSIFFVKYSPKMFEPTVVEVSTAEAGARVYANGLNQLAHPADGLDAAIEIAKHSRCYELKSVDLKSTCELVVDLLNNIS